MSSENRIPDALSRWFESKIYREKFKKLTEGINTKEIEINEQDFICKNNW